MKKKRKRYSIVMWANFYPDEGDIFMHSTKRGAEVCRMTGGKTIYVRVTEIPSKKGGKT